MSHIEGHATELSVPDRAQIADPRTEADLIVSAIWRNVLPHLTSQERTLEELTNILRNMANVTSFRLLLVHRNVHLVHRNVHPADSKAEEPSLHTVAFWSEALDTSSRCPAGKVHLDLESISAHSCAPSAQECAPGDRVAIGEGVCGHVALTGQVYNVSDVNKEPRYKDAYPRPEARSELAIPLIAAQPHRDSRLRSKVIGVLDLWRRPPAAFTKSDEESMVAVAEQIAAALNYTLQYSQLDREAQESASQLDEQTTQLRAERDRAGFLYRVTQEMTRTLDLERVLNRTLARVSQALGIRQSSLLLLDPESGYLVYRVAIGRATALPRGGKPTRYRRGVGLAGWVLEHNEVAIITGFDADPRWDIDPSQ